MFFYLNIFCGFFWSENTRRDKSISCLLFQFCVAYYRYRIKYMTSNNKNNYISTLNVLDGCVWLDRHCPWHLIQLVHWYFTYGSECIKRFFLKKKLSIWLEIASPFYRKRKHLQSYIVYSNLKCQTNDHIVTDMQMKLQTNTRNQKDWTNFSLMCGRE